jgi:protein-disulfide isomerase-like protein with CxxC motif
LNSLSATSTGGITLTSYNGSASVSDLAINLDGGSLTTGTDGLKIATGGIATIHYGDATITGAKIASATVQTLNLANLAVTDAKLASNAVVTAKINDGAVTAAKIAGDAIDASKIADGAVQREHLNSNVVNAAGALGLDPTNNDLLVITGASMDINGSNELVVADGGVDSTQLADDAVTSAKIADGAVGTAAIADGAVNAAKVADSTLTSGKLNFVASYETLSAGDGSTTAFEASSEADANMMGGIMVFRNGLAMGLVQSNPSGQDQYTVGNTGIQDRLVITFGSAPNSGDQITVMYFSL